MLVDTTKDFQPPLNWGWRKIFNWPKMAERWGKETSLRTKRPQVSSDQKPGFCCIYGNTQWYRDFSKPIWIPINQPAKWSFWTLFKRFLMESLRILKAINSSFRLWISPCRFWQVVTLILGGFDFEVKGISTWFDVKASGAFFWKENVDLSSFKKTHALCPRFLDMLICLMIFFTDELLSVQHHEKALFRGSYILWFPFSASQNRRRISWITNLLLQLIDFFLECPWY